MCPVLGGREEGVAAYVRVSSPHRASQAKGGASFKRKNDVASFVCMLVRVLVRHFTPSHHLIHPLPFLSSFQHPTLSFLIPLPTLFHIPHLLASLFPHSKPSTLPLSSFQIPFPFFLGPREQNSHTAPPPAPQRPNTTPPLLITLKWP